MSIASENEKAKHRGDMERSQQPKLSTKTWHRGIRLSSVYAVKYFSNATNRGIYVYTAHNGVDTRHVIKIDFKSDTKDLDKRLSEFARLRDDIAAEFMVDDK